MYICVICGKITPTKAKTRDMLKYQTLKNITGLRRFLEKDGFSLEE